VVLDGDENPVGVLIPAALPSFYIAPDSGADSAQHGRLQELQYLMLAKRADRLRVRRLDQTELLGFLERLAKVLGVFEKHNVVHGDLSMRNILWSFDAHNPCFILDCDGVTVDGIGAGLAPVTTPGWSDPRLMNRSITRPDLSSDWYALAAAIYRTLFQTAGNDLSGLVASEFPKQPPIPEQAKDLFLKSFAPSGQRARPYAWAHQLRQIKSGDFKGAAAARYSPTSPTGSKKATPPRPSPSPRTSPPASIRASQGPTRSSGAPSPSPATNPAAPVVATSQATGRKRRWPKVLVAAALVVAAAIGGTLALTDRSGTDTAIETAGAAVAEATTTPEAPATRVTDSSTNQTSTSAGSGSNEEEASGEGNAAPSAAAAPTTRPPTSTPTPVPTVAPTTTFPLAIGALNVRALPSTNAEIVVEIDKGDRVTVNGSPIISEGRFWQQIEAPGGESGWVAANYLVDPPACERRVDNPPGGNLAVRQSPREAAPIVKAGGVPVRLSSEAVVKVNAIDGDWYEVSEPASGWIFAPFVSLICNGQPTPSRDGEFYGESVNIRTEPSLDGSVVSRLTGGLGAPIAITAGPTSGGWYEIEVNTSSGLKTGWVFGAFILPPSNGWFVAENRAGKTQTIALLDSSGRSIGVSNPTAGALLIGEMEGRYWLVQLPDGNVAYVDSYEVRIIGK